MSTNGCGLPSVCQRGLARARLPDHRGNAVRWAPLSFIPGAFVGAACFFGNGTIWQSTLISLVASAVLAYASERLGDVLARPAAQPRLEGA